MSLTIYYCLVWMVSSKWNALVEYYCTDIYFHCRSQKTCRLQKDSGVYTGLSGLSLSGMASGPVLGFSAQPRTVQKEKSNMSSKHQQLTANQIDKALEVNFTYLSMYIIHKATWKDCQWKTFQLKNHDKLLYGKNYMFTDL